MSEAMTSELRSGWRVLSGSFLGIAIGVSSLYFYSLGIFIKPLAAEFGWTRGEASLGALVGTAAAAIMSPFMGRIVDRIGSTNVAVCSLLLLAAGLAAHGLFISGLKSFLAITFLFSLATAGSSPLPYTRLTVAHFDVHRGLALGFVLGGTGLGAILIPRLLVPFVAAEGWRAGYLALGAVSLLLLPVVFVLLHGSRDPSAARTPLLPLVQIVHTRGFFPLAAMFLLAAVAILGTVVQFVPMLTDAGLTPAQAGATAALIGLSAIVGRLAVGALLDRISPAIVSGGLFLIAAFGLLTLSIGGIVLAVPGAVICGVAVGAEVDLLSFLTARYFPRTAFGQVNGLLYGLFLTGGAIGPWVSGKIYDATGNYAASLMVAAVLLAGASIIGFSLPKPVVRA